MKNILAENVQYQKVKRPVCKEPGDCPELPGQVYEKRYERLYERMDEDGLDVAVIYGDREHYSNFRYLAAFDPRFEEGVLVVHRNGKNYVLLGNECLNLYRECKVAAYSARYCRCRTSRWMSFGRWKNLSAVRESKMA